MMNGAPVEMGSFDLATVCFVVAGIAVAIAIFCAGMAIANGGFRWKS